MLQGSVTACNARRSSLRGLTLLGSSPGSREEDHGRLLSPLLPPREGQSVRSSIASVAGRRGPRHLLDCADVVVVVVVVVVLAVLVVVVVVGVVIT